MKIVLIGPMCVGKSTIGSKLADLLNLPFLEMDDLRWSLYPDAGYDEEVARRIYQAEGTLGVLRYSKPFEASAVQKTVRQQGDFVLALGAGHSVFEDKGLFALVEQALKPLPHVFLLMPSIDQERSIHICNQRFSDLLLEEVGEVDDRLLELNEHYVRHPSNRLLAKYVIYTEGKKPNQICSVIIGLLPSG
jgi:shikimate kinase